MEFFRRCRVLLLGATVTLFGCTTPPPAPLYQLDAGALTLPTTRSGVVVLLGPLTLAQYLQRDELLQRQADGSLLLSEARWAGNLPEDIAQLLQHQLASRLQSSNVLVAPGPAGLNVDVQLLVQISRLDSGSLQPAVLQAQWRLLDKNGQLRDQRLVQLEQAHAPGLASQVQAQSLLLQQLAEQLALAVSSFTRQAASSAAGSRAPAPARKAVEPAPKLPAAPMGGTAEVYRF